MKKINKTISVFLIIILSIILSSCAIIKQATCEHDWEDKITQEATCEENGIIEKTCSLCGKTMHERIKSQGHKITEGEEKQATCEEDGYKRGSCSVCGKDTTIIYKKTGHDFSDWKTITNATDQADGLENRTCNNCGKIEERIISKLDYIDLSVIKYQFIEKSEYNVTTEDELALLYSSAILNRIDKIVCNLKFSFDDFNAMFDRVKANQTVDATYQASASLKGTQLTISFTHGELPTKTTTSEKRYIQYASLNAYKNTPTRNNEYDDFKINNAQYSYPVTTSDQLFYCLERGVKPLPKASSIAEEIYNKAKDVLREIINDDMNDYAKIRAIHDWLIMNVTYDNALYDLLYAGASDLKSYNGFYLEGVFNDGYAVCEGISKAFSVLANIEGIRCVQVTGYMKQNPTGAGHAWNKIFVDGNWYVIDATSDGTIVSEKFEMLSYEFFLISDEAMSKSTNQYIGNDFTYLECNNNYNPYNEFKYNQTNTFEIKSSQELKALVLAFSNLPDKNKTVQIKFNYSYGLSKSNAVQKAYTENLLISNFTYIESDDIFTIITSKNE